MKDSILADKAMDFAVKIVELHKELLYKKKEREMAGVRCMVYGVWCMVYGVRCMV